MSFTREEMTKILQEGKSVFYGHGAQQRIITRPEDLPSEAELAGDDAVRLTAARETLVAQRDHLDAEIAAVDARLAAGVGYEAPAEDAGGEARKDEPPAKSPADAKKGAK